MPICIHNYVCLVKIVTIISFLFSKLTWVKEFITSMFISTYFPSTKIFSVTENSHLQYLFSTLTKIIRLKNLNISVYFLIRRKLFCFAIEMVQWSLEVLAQLTNVEIARSDVVTRVRIQNLTVVCEFIFSGLPLHLR